MRAPVSGEGQRRGSGHWASGTITILPQVMTAAVTKISLRAVADRNSLKAACHTVELPLRDPGNQLLGLFTGAVGNTKIICT